MKLLIVDDSMVIRRKIQRALESQCDEHIFTAADGAEAINIFERELPDVVTMDLTMPKVDGVECVKHLIAMKPNVHILVISALTDKSTALQAVKNGAEGFLAKPFSDQELNDALSELIGAAEATV